MTTYSFLDVNASITGPGGTFSLGTGASVAEEGITIEFADDKDTMVIGADGNGQHNLHAGQSGTVTLRYLKTSPTNHQLSVMYNLQTASSALHGLNTIVISNPVSGDVTTALQCAFRKQPPNTYAKEGPAMEWVFNAIRIFSLLGDNS